MENLKAAWILNEMADLLELKGENPFKISAYRRGADILEGLREPLPLIAAEKRLTQLPGIGEALARDIQEILERDTCSLHEELLEEVPRGLIQLLDVPGIGPKKALLFYREMNISTISQLEEAAKKKRLRHLKGIGAKTEFQILNGIQRLRSRPGSILLEQGLAIGELLIEKLKSQPEVEDLSLVGGVRRREELMEAVEILLSTEERERVLEAFHLLPGIQKIERKENGSIEMLLREGFPIHVYTALPEEYPYRLHQLTGSKKHLSQLKEWAKERGMGYRREGLYRGEEVLAISSEEEIYSSLKIPYILPELRQGNKEITMAKEGLLPESISFEDIKGDLHVHTSWSDGGHTIEEMVERAIELGYSYMAICDHSPSLTVASGLSSDRLEEQMERIDELQEIYAPFTILKGVEVDIKRDGSLDHPQEVLQAMDLVVASIHIGLKDDRERITSRVLKAMENPLVHIIAHPTGRILGYREPSQVHIERILEAAKEYNKVLEINVAPDRLDLAHDYIRKAKEMEIRLAINTDAHAVSHLDYMRAGVAYARRGYLEARDVINTYDLDRLLESLS